MKPEDIKILSRKNFSKACAFEVARNIYDNESFIKEHFKELSKLNEVVNKYDCDTFYDASASIEFNYHKVNICYYVYSVDKRGADFVKEFESIIKKYFPSAKKVYDSKHECFVNFGKNFKGEKNRND